MVCCCSLGQAWGRDCASCPVQGTLARAALCGADVPQGVIKDPVTNLTREIDECALLPGICQHGTCVNTPGSFACECELGFVYDRASHQCIDRNECQVGAEEAGASPGQVCRGNSRCVNAVGSFECRCPRGYR